MKALRDNAAYYDAFSGSYEDRRGRGYHLFLDTMECALVRRYAGPAHELLEVGCGTGLIMEKIQAHVGSVTGVDLSAGMLEQARLKGLNVLRADATSLPFANASFDVVYSFKVLAHVPAIRETFGEVERVLKPGGRAILEFYNARSLRSLRKRLVRGRVAPGVSEDEVYTRHDTAEAIRTYLSEGLEIEGFHGLMVVTPAAQVHAIPLLGPVVRAVERIVGQSPLGRFGGFLSAVVRKIR